MLLTSLLLFLLATLTLAVEPCVFEYWPKGPVYNFNRTVVEYASTLTTTITLNCPAGCEVKTVEFGQGPVRRINATVTANATTVTEARCTPFEDTQGTFTRSLATASMVYMVRKNSIAKPTS